MDVVNNEIVLQLDVVEKIEITGVMKYRSGGMFDSRIEIVSKDVIYDLWNLFKQHAIDNKVIILSAEIVDIS